MRVSNSGLRSFSPLQRGGYTRHFIFHGWWFGGLWTLVWRFEGFRVPVSGIRFRPLSFGRYGLLKWVSLGIVGVEYTDMSRDMRAYDPVGPLVVSDCCFLTQSETSKTRLEAP